MSYVGIVFRGCQAYLIWMISPLVELKRSQTRTGPHGFAQRGKRRIKTSFSKRVNPKLTSTIALAYFGCRSIASTSPQQIDLVQQTPGSQCCAQCEKYGSSLSYCNVCTVSFCFGCWESQITHKSNRLAPGAVPHERTDHNIAKTIQTVLEVKKTDEEQAVLHQNDQDTTWFGIIREDSELPIFRDYGRYASLMTNTSRSERSRDFTGAVHGRDTRYPSLVSFVGQTGNYPFAYAIKIIDMLCRRRKEHNHKISN